jgi:hypothetical protein
LHKALSTKTNHPLCLPPLLTAHLPSLQPSGCKTWSGVSIDRKIFSYIDHRRKGKSTSQNLVISAECVDKEELMDAKIPSI